MCFDFLSMLGVWDIINISGHQSDWQIITSIHIYSSICHIDKYRNVKGPYFTNCGGSGIFYLSRNGFAKLTPKTGRVFFTFLLPSDVFWFPLYARCLRYHKHFRAPVRLTNDNFHTHIQYCITFLQLYLSYWQMHICGSSSCQ